MVTRACKARHDTEAAMTPDDDPWNLKAHQHSVISESHDYGKFLVKITMSVIFKTTWEAKWSGGEMKGSDATVVFTATDASRSEKKSEK